MSDEHMYCHKMPSKVSEMLRQAVVEKWMSGLKRDVIADECEISTGAVSTIIQEWKGSVGFDAADLIRDLGVTLRKMGISPAQCATGLRIANILKEMGYEEDALDEFISEVYKKLKDLGASPKLVAECLQNLFSLSQSTIEPQGPTITPISKISRIIEKMKLQKGELEHGVRTLESRKDHLAELCLVHENVMKQILEEKRTLELDLGWKSQLREELEKSGLETNDVSKLAEATQFYRKSGYSMSAMLTKFSNYEGLETAISSQENYLEGLSQKRHQLQGLIAFEEELLNRHRLRNMEFDALGEMGFGTKELKLLRSMITEVAVESEIFSKTKGEAVKKFVDDVEANYFDYIRLRKRTEELRSEISTLNLNRDNIATLNSAIPVLGRAMNKLLNRVKKKEDLIRIANLLEKNPEILEDCVMEFEARIESGYSASEEESSTTNEKVRSPRSLREWAGYYYF